MYQPSRIVQAIEPSDISPGHVPVVYWGEDCGPNPIGESVRLMRTDSALSDFGLVKFVLPASARGTLEDNIPRVFDYLQFKSGVSAALQTATYQPSGAITISSTHPPLTAADIKFTPVVKHLEALDTAYQLTDPAASFDAFFARVKEAGPAGFTREYYNDIPFHYITEVFPDDAIPEWAPSHSRHEVCLQLFFCTSHFIALCCPSSGFFHSSANKASPPQGYCFYLGVFLLLGSHSSGFPGIAFLARGFPFFS
jgi:hypothetical protein